MPSLDKISFISSYPTDKIVNIFEDVVDMSNYSEFAFGLKRVTIPHSFPRPVFTKTIFGIDFGSDTTFLDASISSFGIPPGVGLISYSDSNNIYLLTSDTNAPIRHRVISYWIEDYDSSNPTVPPTTGTPDNVHFDSRLNYQKLFKQEELVFPSTTSDNTLTVNHNLGYRPNVRVFFEALQGEVWPANFGGVQNPVLYDFTNQAECDYEIYTDRVEVTVYLNNTPRKAWVRIYYDG